MEMGRDLLLDIKDLFEFCIFGIPASVVSVRPWDWELGDIFS